MNNLRKIGLSALAGSMALATSAQAFARRATDLSDLRARLVCINREKSSPLPRSSAIARSLHRDRSHVPCRFDRVSCRDSVYRPCHTLTLDRYPFQCGSVLIR